MLKRLGRSLMHGIIIMGLMGSVALIVRQTAVLRNIEVLNPLEDAFAEFDLTDLVVSKIMDHQQADTNITVVNIGSLDRSGLSSLISIINQYQPKVVGFDVQLKFAKDSIGDQMLADAFRQTPNLVMATQLLDKTAKKYYLRTNYDRFTKNAHTGFVNLITKGKGNQLSWPTVRSFSPKETVTDLVYSGGAPKFDTAATKKPRKEYAFAVKMAQLYAPKKTKAFLKRNKEYEWINFLGNISVTAGKASNFAVLDVNDIFKSVQDTSSKIGNVLKDKIVILGFMGSSLAAKSFDDKLFTPLNDNYIGRGTPDMYGVVVHANIVSMILRGDFIKEADPWLNNSISIFIILITVMIFSYIFIKVGIWYDALTIFIQAIIVLSLVGLMLFVFYKTNTKMDLGTGLLGVVLSGIFVEIYHGFIRKLFGWRPPNEVAMQNQKPEISEEQEEK
jgi:CHASE2 domain-containing sensor protein